MDAVRVVLGNTGSKTTIHKDLRELEEEEGGPGGRNVSISEGAPNLVARLATQLQDEAEATVELVKAQAAASNHQHEELAANLRKELDVTVDQLRRAQTTFEQEMAAHGRTKGSPPRRNDRPSYR